MASTSRLGEFASRTRWVLAFAPFWCVVAVILVFCTDTFTANSVADGISSHITDDDLASLFFRFFCGLRHAAAFLVLGLVAFPFFRFRAHGWCVAMAACGGVALLSEVFQGLFTLTRKPALIDIGVDLVAATAGFGLLRLASSCQGRFAWAAVGTRFIARQAAVSLQRLTGVALAGLAAMAHGPGAVPSHIAVPLSARKQQPHLRERQPRLRLLSHSRRSPTITV